MATLEISTLGSLQITRNRAPVSGFLSDKVRALLVYLAMEQDRPFRRETIANLFWSEQPKSKARGNLRRALANLRQVIDDENGRFLHVTRQTLQFNAASPACVDAVQFAKLLGQPEPTLAQMETAVALPNGRFLDGFSVDDSMMFEEWALLKREEIQRQLLQTLHRLTTYYEAHHQPETAVRYAWQQVNTEPWYEPGQRQLLRLLVQTHQRSSALVHYEQFRSNLRAELGVEPEPATRRLYEQIRDTPSSVTPATPHPPFLTEPPVSEPQPFVARQEELARLQTFLATAVTGKGQFGFISGETGSGKTTLLRAFAQQAQRQHPHLIPLYGGSTAHTRPGTPYQTFRTLLAHALGDLESLWRDGTLSRTQTERLWTLRDNALTLIVNAAPDSLNMLVDATLLPENLRPTDDAQAPPQAILFNQITHFLQKFSQHGPLLLLLDDLQWADSGTLDLLFYLRDQLAGFPIFVLGTYRPEDLQPRQTGDAQHPLTRLLHEFTRAFGDITVPLNQSDGRSFIDAWLDTEPNQLDEAFRHTLFTQTKGHALFTVELVNSLRERGDLQQDGQGRWQANETVCWSQLPAKTEAIIAERIGRLPPQLRQLLGIASIQGERFAAEIVALIGQRPFPETLRAFSTELTRRHKLLQPLGRQSVAGKTLSHYRFRHNLFYQYVYGRLDANERAYLHLRTGETMLELYGTAVTQPSPVAAELAHHFDAAQHVPQAIAYHQLAGQHALRLSAPDEAISHYERCLTLLATQPNTSENLQQEINCQLELGAALLSLYGYTNRKVRAAYDRAYERCCQTAATPEMITSLFWLTSYFAVSGDLLQAVTLAEQMLDNVGCYPVSDMHVIQAHVLAGLPLFFMGHNTAALAHFRQASALYDPPQHQPLIYTFGQDPGIAAMMWQGHVLLHMGCLAEAKRCLQQALNWASTVDHPYTAAFTHLLAGGTPHSWYVTDWDVALEHLNTAVELAETHRFRYLLALGTFYLGQVTAMSQWPPADKGVALMQQGLEMEASIGSRLGLSARYVVLADTHRQRGQTTEAWQAIHQARCEADGRQELYLKPEIDRIAGELHLLAGHTLRAEACWHRALQTAREQGAKTWELKATTALCRLWYDQGKFQKAHNLLAPIYGQFAQEFTSPDVMAAKRLLALIAAEAAQLP